MPPWGWDSTCRLTPTRLLRLRHGVLSYGGPVSCSLLTNSGRVIHCGHTLPALIMQLTTHMYLKQNILSNLKYAIVRYSPSRIRRPEKSKERASEPFPL